MKQVVYTASPDSQEIHVWALSDSGELDLLQVVEVDGQVQPLYINPQKTMLYAGVKPEFRVIAWSIAKDGTLTEAGHAPLPGSATHITADPEGRSLFIGFYHEGVLTRSDLDDAGLPSAPRQTFSGMDGCHSSNADNAGKLLYVPALKQDRVCVFPIDEQGALKEQIGQIDTATGAGPRHMAFHPQGEYAYVLNELDSSVCVLKLTPQGGEIVQTLDIMPESFEGTRWAADIHITPNGKFLYACDRTSSTLTILQVSEKGDHVKVAGFQPTETQPRGFNIDHRGEYLVAAGQKSQHIEIYKIDQQDGLLLPLARYEVGKGAMWVLIHELTD